MKMINSRKLHRWLSIVAAILFLNVSITGVILQAQQLVNEDEEENRVSVSQLDKPLNFDPAALTRAQAVVWKAYGNRPVNGLDWQLGAAEPVYIFHLGGKEPTAVTVNVQKAEITHARPDGEGWLIKLHTGEIIGDGGKVLGLLWGLGLVFMTVTGLLMYMQIYKARRQKLKGTSIRERFFWSLILLLFVLGPLP